MRLIPGTLPAQGPGFNARTGGSELVPRAGGELRVAAGRYDWMPSSWLAASRCVW